MMALVSSSWIILRNGSILYSLGNDYRLMVKIVPRETQVKANVVSNFDVSTWRQIDDWRSGEESLKPVNGHFRIVLVQSHSGDFNKTCKK